MNRNRAYSTVTRVGFIALHWKRILIDYELHWLRSSNMERQVDAFSDYLNQYETYLRLGLKAQSQCRATLEALAAIKNPRPGVAFVQQANIAHKGRILWQGPAAQIDCSGNEYVDQFIHGRGQGPIQMEVLKG